MTDHSQSISALDRVTFGQLGDLGHASCPGQVSQGSHASVLCTVVGCACQAHKSAGATADGCLTLLVHLVLGNATTATCTHCGFVCRPCSVRCILLLTFWQPGLLGPSSICFKAGYSARVGRKTDVMHGILVFLFRF